MQGLSATHARLRRRAARHPRVRVPRRRQSRRHYNERVKRRALRSEHPLVTVHAETGERVLFASPSFLKSIVGLTPRESAKILEIIWEHVMRPEYTVRFKWNAGDIAFWDNRSTAHLAPRDIFHSDFDRHFTGSRWWAKLVGVDGRRRGRSRVIRSCRRRKNCG